MKRLSLVSAVVAAVLLAAFAVRHAFPPARSTLPPALEVPAGVAAGFNLVLITLDTVRADYLGCYGSTQAKTPALDALAAGGVRIAQAVTTAPLTLVAHASILTGNYPPRHGVRNNGTFRLAARETTLAERLRSAGYGTAAFIASFVLDNRFGTDQGFELYSDVVDERPGAGNFPTEEPERPGDVVTDEALAWLDGRTRSGGAPPFFLWLHLYDAHAPHTPPEPFRSLFYPNLYAGEVAFVDHQVGRLVNRLRELGLLERTLVVAVGDHGEGLDEHGENTHGLLLYETTVHAPLIYYAPAALPGGKVLDDRVATIADIAPTVLDLLGLATASSDGVSLLQAGTRADRAVYLETLLPRLQRGWSELRGLRRRDAVYIEAPTPEYYNLAADPTQRKNLFETSKEARMLQKKLAEFITAFPGEENAASAALQPDEETVRKLTALGYVGGPAPASWPPPDPKDAIARWSRTRELATAARDKGLLAEATNLLQGFLAESPGDGDTWGLLAEVQEQAGRLEDALHSRIKAIDLQPGNPAVWLSLARLQLGRNDLAGMKLSLEKASRIDPSHGMSLLLQALLAREEGRFTEALALCREARKRDPARYTKASWNMEAALLEERGRTAGASAAYRHVLEIDPRDQAALQGLERLDRRQ